MPQEIIILNKPKAKQDEVNAVAIEIESIVNDPYKFARRYMGMADVDREDFMRKMKKAYNTMEMTWTS